MVLSSAKNNILMALGKFKKKTQKNIWMDLVHNGGGGFRAKSTFARFFFYF